MHVASRSRLWVGIGIVTVILLGLASRKYPFIFPSILGKYPGDSLWALMVFLGWAFLKPRASTWTIAALALTTSCLVEFSQLYQDEWINAIRRTTLGHLALGTTFSWADIAAYTMGILFGLLVDGITRFTSKSGEDDSKRLPMTDSRGAAGSTVSEE